MVEFSRLEINGEKNMPAIRLITITAFKLGTSAATAGWKTLMFNIWQGQVGIGLLLLLGVFSSSLFAEETVTDLGLPLSSLEISKHAITIFPDGSNLPAGQGSVQEGKALYQNQCMMCHGKKGIEGPAARLAGSDGWFSFSDPLRILRIDKNPVLLISVGGLWPHATTIFDYTRRAMPHFAPKSLNNNEVYALTAYLLHLNGLVGQDLILDKRNLPKVSMPGKERSVLAWPE